MNTPDVVHQAFAELGLALAVFAPPKLRIVVGVLVMGFVGCGQLLFYFSTPHAINAEQQADKVGCSSWGGAVWL
jgi:hypothetical protein